MKYIKKFSKILEQNDDFTNNYIEEVRNHIRDNDIEYFENNSIEDYEYNEFIVIATMYGRKEIVELLIDEGIDVNQTNNPSRTAAYYTDRYPDILEILLENGLDIDKEDDWDETFFSVISDKTLNKLKDNKYLREYFKKKNVKKFKI